MSPARGKPVPAGCCASWVGRGVCPRRASLATSTGKQQHQIHNVVSRGQESCIAGAWHIAETNGRGC
ncbi:hypothetical protein PVAP13_5KG360507 [Panicum virgatum]|uniref:Uncharacterized protein n=1 Tax=Panicum virgatum TaxID=38727 RepID=A0A8T0SFY6_PANVG|nr:hypothetical protein PVAP13_5KG360507 [Panicum virgatum]